MYFSIPAHLQKQLQASGAQLEAPADAADKRNKYYAQALERAKQIELFNPDAIGTLSSHATSDTVLKSSGDVADILEATNDSSLCFKIQAAPYIPANQRDGNSTYFTIPRERLIAAQERLNEITTALGTPHCHLVLEDIPQIAAGSNNFWGRSEMTVSAHTLATLSQDELSALMAHEVGHLKRQHTQETLEYYASLPTAHTPEEKRYIDTMVRAMRRGNEFEADATAIELGYGRAAETQLLRSAAQIFAYHDSVAAGIDYDLKLNINSNHPSTIQRAARITALNDTRDEAQEKHKDTLKLENPDVYLPDNAPAALPGTKALDRRAKVLGGVPPR